jgi:hypothetical protein
MKRPTAKKARKARPWTKEDILTLNALARDGIKTTAIARKLKRTPTATRQKASALGVKLVGASQRKRKG